MEKIVPRINMNGMTANEHIELRLKARKALQELRGVVNELAPHGRDYLGDQADYAKDRETHYERVRYLDGLFETLLEEALAIQDQQ